MKCKATAHPVHRELQKYSPQPDFSICKLTLPLLLLKVNSTSFGFGSKHTDLIQMLLVGATIVQFANTFLKIFHATKNFVLCSIFISDNSTTTCYTLFQDGNHKVCCFLYVRKFVSSVMAGLLQCKHLLTQ